MLISPLRSFLIILVVGITTFLTRLIPFIFFPEGKEVPKVIQYLGDYLPPAVIGMLIIYCLKSVSVVKAPFGLPELIAGTMVVLLHIWKRNNLLSIGVGTVVYMVLVQVVFV